MSFYSKLEAVNTMLLESGEHLVNDLNSEQGVDTSVAQFILDQTTKTFITRGLANNRYAMKLTPDIHGNIFLPDGTCYAQILDYYPNPETGGPMMTTVRTEPTRLFNIATQSDVFDMAYNIDIIIEIKWEDIDANVQKAIIATSSRDYQRVTLGDNYLDRALAEKEMKLVARGRAADINKKRRNIFSPFQAGTENPRMG